MSDQPNAYRPALRLRRHPVRKAPPLSAGRKARFPEILAYDLVLMDVRRPGMEESAGASDVSAVKARLAGLDRPFNALNDAMEAEPW